MDPDREHFSDDDSPRVSRVCCGTSLVCRGTHEANEAIATANAFVRVEWPSGDNKISLIVIRKTFSQNFQSEPPRASRYVPF